MKRSYISLLLPCLALICSSCSSQKSGYSDDILYSDNYTASNVKAVSALPQSGKILSLNEATRIALANNPNIQIAELKTITASAQYYGSILANTPAVTATGGVYKTSPNTPINNQLNPQTGGAVTTSMTLWNGLQSQMNVLSAKAQTISADEMSLNTRRLLTMQLAIVYNAILMDKVNIKIQRDNMAFYQKQLQKLQSKPKPDKSAMSDALQFKTNIDLAQSAVVKSIENFNNNKCALAVLMGLPSAQLPANTLFPEIEIAKDAQKALGVDYYLDMAVNQRPDLKASKENLKASNYNLYSSYGQLSPTVGAGVAVGNQNIATNPTGVNAAVNLNPASSITNIRTAQAQKDSANEELVGTWIQAASDVRTSYNQLAASVATEKILKDQCALGLQSRDIVAREYDNGKVSISEVIETQNELIKAEREHLQSIADISNYQTQLDAATGIDMK